MKNIETLARLKLEYHLVSGMMSDRRDVSPQISRVSCGIRYRGTYIVIIYSVSVPLI